jgi:hypothetical protein
MHAVTLVVLGFLSVITVGCHRAPPTKAPNAVATTAVTPSPPPSSGAKADDDSDWSADEIPKLEKTPRAANDTVPRVIRRIVAEQKEEVQHLLELASDLSDPRGRARATTEASSLSSELGQITAPINRADSDGLDQVITKLVLLDTRIGILHDALRDATSRGTATVME